MISLKLIPVVVILLIVAYLAGLSFTTRQHKLKPENEHHLTPCPDKPNCVSSQSQQKTQTIQAFLLLNNNQLLSWGKLITAIEQSGGEILVNEGQYCHAVFTSRLFRFKDDFEARLYEKHIDIRSASRAGTSDFGQNRKRVEKIRQLYKKDALQAN